MQAAINRRVYPVQIIREEKYPLLPLHLNIRFRPRQMLNIPLEADQRAARAVMDRRVPGDLVNRSSTTVITVDFSISGIKDTRRDRRSALETVGIS